MTKWRNTVKVGLRTPLLRWAPLPTAPATRASCNTPGCTRETWNGQTGEQCYHTCTRSYTTSHDLTESNEQARHVHRLSTITITDQGNRPCTFYHTTNLKAALVIQAVGFQVSSGLGGCLGPVIYCTTTLIRVFDYLKCEHGVIVFELKVDLGKCKTLQPDDPQMTT